jgi:hypothetical protein
VEAACSLCNLDFGSCFLTPDYGPNNDSVTKILGKLAELYVDQVTAKDAGVDTDKGFLLSRPPPRDNQRLAKGWIRKHINALRKKVDLNPLPDDWVKNQVTGSKETAKIVSKTYTKIRAEKGTLYRHKHDLSPSPCQITTMIHCGMRGDTRIHYDLLQALEASASIAIYLQTGARGMELKGMFLQSLGFERIPHEKSGCEFPCVKLTAFLTKTKLQHLNMFLAHSNPWRCAVGMLGLCILVRVSLHGPPPFTMETSDSSWKVLFSDPSTLDKRIKACMSVAGIRRQSGDPVIYFGRHFGSRSLQHNGGSAEGGAARRGHNTSNSSFHYTCIPLPDMMKLVGNNFEDAFEPAHLSSELDPFADKVLKELFPSLLTEKEAVNKRNLEVDGLRGNVDKVRTAEQLCDRERFLLSLHFLCRTALKILVACPRTWKKNRIIKEEKSVWEGGLDEVHNKVVHLLFGSNLTAATAMNELFNATKKCEEAEIVSLDKKDPGGSSSVAEIVSSAVREVGLMSAAREEKMVSTLIGAVNGERSSPLSFPFCDSVPCLTSASTESCLSEPIKSARVKHKREIQNDIAYFSSWTKVEDALSYALFVLYPKEVENPVKWRIVVRDDGREDKSRDKQWRMYRSLCAYVSILVQEEGLSVSDAISRSQAILDGEVCKGRHTHFLTFISSSLKGKSSSGIDFLMKFCLDALKP